MNIVLINKELCIAEEDLLKDLKIRKNDIIMLRGWHGCGTSHCHTYIAPPDVDLIKWVEECSDVTEYSVMAHDYNLINTDYVHDWSMKENVLIEDVEYNKLFFGFVVSAFMIKNKGDKVKSAIEAYSLMCAKYEDFIKK